MLWFCCDSRNFSNFQIAEFILYFFKTGHFFEYQLLKVKSYFWQVYIQHPCLFFYVIDAKEEQKV